MRLLLSVSTQLKFIKNCSLKAGLNEHRIHHNYKNTKLQIARLTFILNNSMHGVQSQNPTQHCVPRSHHFNIAGINLQYVTEFKYVGHLVHNLIHCVMTDIEREVKNLSGRTNILLRKFGRCSTACFNRIVFAFMILHYKWCNSSVYIISTCYYKV